jgi:hypothetical protein
LIHHHALFGLLDEWLSSLEEAVFQQIVPLRRRAFTGFNQAEWRQVLELALGGSQPMSAPVAAADINLNRCLRVLPIPRQLLGFAPELI